MKSKNSRGFSLLEIVIAMLILGLVTAGLFGLFTTSYGFISKAGRRLQAVNYGREVLETLKIYVSANSATPVNAGSAFTNSNFSAIGLNASNTFGGISFSRSYNVTNDPLNATGLRQVRVTVNWNEP